MKRILLLAIIMLCGLSVGKAQDIVNLRMDRGQLGLRGYVASMDEDILLRKDYFRDDWTDRKWFVRDLRKVLREDQGRIFTFNPAGRLTSVTYTQAGKPGKKTVCTYASNGLLSSYLGEGYKVMAKYKGNYADINVFVETKDYTQSINLAKADLNRAPYKNVYPFDLKCKQEITDNGLVLESRYYYVDSIPARVCLYSYDHRGLMTAERITDYTMGDGELTLVKYTYDNQGFLVKKTINNKAVDETYTYENNELGDCTTMTIVRPYGTSVYTFKYEYDDHDNWVVRLQFLNGAFDNAALRTYTYHTVKVKSQQQLEKEAAAAAAKAQAKADKQAQKEAKAAAKAEKKAQADKGDKKHKADKLTKEEKKAAKEQAKAEKQAKKEQARAAKEAKKQAKAAKKASKKGK
ncbi:MAG: hypothetical protein K5864_08335 [Bacteroidales bacterium]|nr:hypothetical protein [Bacteroidales bacterium]